MITARPDHIHLQAMAETPAACTSRIQAAIDTASQAGGGTVSLSGGRFVVRTIMLQSGVRLRIEAGAVLQADADLSAFPLLGEGRKHLISAQNATGIALEGAGTIDGNVDAVLPRTRWGGYEKLPFEQRLSPLIRFSDCQDALVRDLKIINTQGWTLHPFRCDRVRIQGLRIDNPLGVPNGDGIDIDGCRDVQVSGCHIATGDDGIIIKASREARSCEHITVSDCIIRTYCIGLGLGAGESYWPMRHISFSNCSVPMCSRIIEIGLLDQGLVENVSFTNITGTTYNGFCPERPFCIHIQQRYPEHPLGAVRNVSVRGLMATTRGRILMTAVDGTSIEGVTLSDIHLTLPEIEEPGKALQASNSKRLDGVATDIQTARALLVLNNCRKVMLRDVHVHWPEQTATTARQRGQSQDGGWRRELAESQEADSDRFSADLPMAAVLLRRSHEVRIDAPFLTAHGDVERIRCLDGRHHDSAPKA